LLDGAAPMTEAIQLDETLHDDCGMKRRHLVDGDPASNLGGWQWAASVGTDAQPYFRMFNPVTLGECFDPDGEYVRRWVPELTLCRPRGSTARGP
jgi:deoxyribodipyrimidine photolyase